MRIIVGLGNPGIDYQNTRHNAGQMLVDKIASKLTSDYGWRKFYGISVFKTPDLMLVKTADYFMNESGNVVRDALRADGVMKEDLCIAHDDLDIKLGEYKIQDGVGPKQQNGVLSVEQVLGKKDFQRIRIGIENRVNPIPGEEYVLQKFTLEERQILDEVLEKIADAVT